MNAYVNVPVPETALSAVFTLLAQITSGKAPGTEGNLLVEELATEAPEEDEVPVPVKNNGLWSSADIEELAKKLKNPAGLAMMNLIAGNSVEGKITTYGQLREAGQSVRDDDFGNDHVRAQLSWVAKYCKRIKGENVWPLEVQDHGPDAEPGTRFQYLMPASLAEAWLTTAGD